MKIVTKEDTEVSLNKIEIESKKSKIKLDSEQIILDKIESLLDILSRAKVSPSQYPGQETNYEPCIGDVTYVAQIEQKIMDLVALL